MALVVVVRVTGKEYVHWDGELTGFGVRLRATGAKSFVAVYRTSGRNSRQRCVTIGAVGKIEADKASTIATDTGRIERHIKPLLGKKRIGEIVEAIDGSEFVFPAASGDSHFQGVEKVWRKARIAAGFPDLRLHAPRHGFASVGLARGDALPVIGAILGHADVKTTNRYAHLADDPMRAAADGIATEVANALANRPVGRDNVYRLVPNKR